MTISAPKDFTNSKFAVLHTPVTSAPLSASQEDAGRKLVEDALDVGAAFLKGTGSAFPVQLEPLALRRDELETGAFG